MQKDYWHPGMAAQSRYEQALKQERQSEKKEEEQLQDAVISGREEDSEAAEDCRYLDEHYLEIENRIRNLFWTVSGDYSLDITPDVEAFEQSKYIALYEAVKQGAFNRYFDGKRLNRYLAGKMQMVSESDALMELSQLCVDAAVYPRIRTARLGTEEIRKQAFADMLAVQSTEAELSLFGKVRIAMMKEFLGEESGTVAGTSGKRGVENRKDMSDTGNDVKIPLERMSEVGKLIQEIDTLKKAEHTDDIIKKINSLYSRYFTDQVPETQMGSGTYRSGNGFDISRSNWLDCLDDEQMDEIMEDYLSRLGDDVMCLDISKNHRKRRFGKGSLSGTGPELQETLDAKAFEKVYSYIEQNYGRTYLSEKEQTKVIRKYCRGIHENCTLYYTDGILHSAVNRNNQYRFSQLQFEKNRLYYYNTHWIVKRNIANLADTLQKALILRQEENSSRARSGTLRPTRLWKVNRTEEPKLFDKKRKIENKEFVVDILLDSSGSQAKRQPQIAIQGYIIGAALSAVGIPHRIMGYCTFWDYTILQRYRDYEDDKDMDMRTFEFRASGNNRDGLVLKAVCDSLLECPEEQKILIVLSDGRPSDMSVNRPGTRRPSVYTGEEALRDTAFEVRKARSSGISVLGIFAGDNEDLAAEKKIYGKDFAYIRNISNFSNVVGAYLKKQLEIE